jgi:hypothetical protein
MLRRIAAITCALALAVTAFAHAQQRLMGTIDHVDPAGGILHFDDGRIVHLDPTAWVWADGQYRPVHEVRTGMTVVLGDPPPAATPHMPQAGVVQQPGVATAEIARVDHQAGLIELRDGRAARIDPTTRVWADGQWRAAHELRPGMTIALRDAPPPAVAREPGVVVREPGVVVREPGTVATHPPVEMTGEIARVDRQAGVIEFRDGQVVRLTDQTRVYQRVDIDQLAPGQRILAQDVRPFAFRAPEAPAASPAMPAPAVVTPDPTLPPGPDSPRIIREQQAPGAGAGNGAGTN